MTVLFFIILKLFNMESTIISYSNKKNIYLYDINLSLSILIHPKLEKVIKNRGLEESFDPYYFNNIMVFYRENEIIIYFLFNSFEIHIKSYLEF